MSKDYEEPPSISQLIGINGKLAKRIKQLQAELATALKQLIDYEQVEASVCPEDIGIADYVARLRTELDEVKTENERLKEFARPVIRHHCLSIFDSYLMAAIYRSWLRNWG